MAETRPEFCTDEMLEYLDDLRESGVTNMFGAAPYLERRFKALKKRLEGGYSHETKAKAVLLYWMHTFSERHGLNEEKANG